VSDTASHLVVVRDLRCVAILGVLPEERDRPQPLSVDLDVALHVGASASSDDLADTVNYAAFCDVAVETLATSKCALLEAAVELVGAAILGLDPRVGAVEVTITKLRPPIAHDVATVGVRRRVER